MRVHSAWTIDLGVYNILTYGDLLAEEPVWTLRSTLQVVQLDQSQAPFLRNGGNNVMSTSFKLYVRSTTDGLARATTFNRLTELANQGVKPLYIVTAAGSWKCASAMITDVTTTMEVDSPTKSYCSVSYSLTATQPLVFP